MISLIQNPQLRDRLVRAVDALNEKNPLTGPISQQFQGQSQTARLRECEKVVERLFSTIAVLSAAGISLEEAIAAGCERLERNSTPPRK